MAYGLTIGAYNSPEIDLTELGRRAVAPLAEGDDLAAAREALLRPRVIREFLERYEGHPIPNERIARNMLEDLGVDAGATERTLGFIREGAHDFGLIRTVQGRDWVDLTPGDSESPGRAVPAGDDGAAGVEEAEPELATVDETPEEQSREGQAAEGESVSELQANRKVFITHGRNKKIVEQLKEMLVFGQFEPVVSVERESVSKPVPEKVLDDMRSCAAAIIHVGTERIVDDKGKEHSVINPNVLIEIGAAMMRYGGKFILLVEQGTELPSNLQGLYEVRYEGDVLDNPATMKLLRAFNEFK